MKTLLYAFLLLSATTLAGQSGSTPVPVTISGTEVFTLPSTQTGSTYHIRVYLPEGYATSAKKYPVLYLLDGDHAFAMATDIVTYMQYGKHIPELIIVSPAYNDKSGPDQGGLNERRRDFSPFKWDAVPSDPGAEAYYAFFTETLIPHIEKTYRTDPEDRTIWGYSRSGLFVLWTLFEKPGIFQRYIALDTGFHLFSELEERYHSQQQSLPASLFIGYGSVGNGKNDLAFMETLASRKYKKFRYEYLALQGGKHLMIPANGLALGLEFVFAQ